MTARSASKPKRRVVLIGAAGKVVMRKLQRLIVHQAAIDADEFIRVGSSAVPGGLLGHKFAAARLVIGRRAGQPSCGEANRKRPAGEGGHSESLPFARRHGAGEQFLHVERKGAWDSITVTTD